MLWAVATVLYGTRGAAVSPVRLNAIKGVGVTLLFAAVLAATDPHAFARLMASPSRAGHARFSGVIGISSATRSTSPPSTGSGPGAIALLLPDVDADDRRRRGRTSRWANASDRGRLVGIALTLAGVAWVVAERSPRCRADASVSDDRKSESRSVRQPNRNRPRSPASTQDPSPWASFSACSPPWAGDRCDHQPIRASSAATSAAGDRVLSAWRFDLAVLPSPSARQRTGRTRAGQGLALRRRAALDGHFRRHLAATGRLRQCTRQARRRRS